MQHYDIAIVGAGPAGSLTALSFARQVAREKNEKPAASAKPIRLLWVDKRRLVGREEPDGFEKSCGGLLDKRAQKALAAYGLAVPSWVMAEPQIFTLRGIDLDNKGATRYYQRQYVNINRFRFDRWLCEEAQRALTAAGIEFDFCDETTAFAVCDKGTDLGGPLLSLRNEKNAEIHQVETSFIAACDGGTSWLRRYCEEKSGKKHPLDRYASIQEWYECPTDQMPACFTAVFDRKVTNYYSWMIPENGQILVGSTLRGDASATVKFEKYKEDLRKLGLLPNKFIKRRGAIIFRPRAIGSCFTGYGPIFLAGEAAGLISPSTCEGISFALRSGYALGRAIGTDFTPLTQGNVHRIRAQYSKDFRKLSQKIFWMSFKSPIMYGPFLRSLVFKSGALSMKIEK